MRHQSLTSVWLFPSPAPPEPPFLDPPWEDSPALLTVPVPIHLPWIWGWEQSRAAPGQLGAPGLLSSGHMGSGKWVNPLCTTVLPSSCCCGTQTPSGHGDILLCAWASWPISRAEHPASSTARCPASLPAPTQHTTKHCELKGTQGRCYLRAAPEGTLLVMSEVLFRRLLLASSWLRGTELARVDTRSRSWWSSLRLRRSRLLCCWLLERHSLLIRLCDTTSSKRCRCFLGMKILADRTREGVRIGVEVAVAQSSGSCCISERKGESCTGPRVLSASAFPRAVSTRAQGWGHQGRQEQREPWGHQGCWLHLLLCPMHGSIRVRNSEPSTCRDQLKQLRSSLCPIPDLFKHWPWYATKA